MLFFFIFFQFYSDIIWWLLLNFSFKIEQKVYLFIYSKLLLVICFNIALCTCQSQFLLWPTASSKTTDHFFEMQTLLSFQ